MRKEPTNPKRFRKIISMLSEDKKYSWNKFFELTKCLVSGKTIAEVLESVFERTIRLKVDEIIYTYGWDFSSSQWFTTTRDWPNWGGFVKLWGLPLKSLICLLKTFIFTCKLTLGSSYRHFIKEVISSATTVHTDQFIIWCNFSRQVTNTNMVSIVYKMIWNNKSESFF